MVLGFGDPTKGMTRIWGHFVILDVCECVILRPHIMLNPREKNWVVKVGRVLPLVSKQRLRD